MQARRGIGGWGQTALACCLFLAAGCRNCDKVEAELRSKDRELYQLRDELYHTEAYNHALRREVGALRVGAAGPPELAGQTYTLTNLSLGRQTGGYNTGESAGDDALQVILEPKDPDGHTIKAPGSVEILVQEITREGLKVPLSSWTIPPDQLRRSWRTGLLSTGYALVLPWKVWPNNEKLRVAVQFQLPDGRLFEADKDVTVRLAPQRKRPMPPADGVIPAPQPNDHHILPPPHKLEGPLPPDGWYETPLSRAILGPRWHETAASPLAGAAQLEQPVSAR
jgi:hypothetical protein